MEKVYIVGAGMTRFSKHPDQSVKQLAAPWKDAQLGAAKAHNVSGQTVTGLEMIL